MTIQESILTESLLAGARSLQYNKELETDQKADYERILLNLRDKLFQAEAEASNAPLTLEELREMDGEPVWITSISREYDPCWGLINALDERVYDADDGFCPFREYGKDWLAYRRRPDSENK